LLVCIAMFGFGFALVPLYDVFCRYTGINGKTANTPAQATTVMDEKRTITVEFLANSDASIPWDFAPEIQQISLHPGEITVINYHVENLSKEAMIGRAVPSVSPGEAARYFKKIECFCFTEQPLNAGQQKDMPVQFYIDPEIPSHFTTITLSYRLYKSTPQTAVR
jgi:cytochrome c oxidase assembly protein subunit 11